MDRHRRRPRRGRERSVRRPPGRVRARVVARTRRGRRHGRWAPSEGRPSGGAGAAGSLGRRAVLGGVAAAVLGALHGRDDGASGRRPGGTSPRTGAEISQSTTFHHEKGDEHAHRNDDGRRLGLGRLRHAPRRVPPPERARRARQRVRDRLRRSASRRDGAAPGLDRPGRSPAGGPRAPLRRAGRDGAGPGARRHGHRPSVPVQPVRMEPVPAIRAPSNATSTTPVSALSPMRGSQMKLPAE